MDTRGNGKRTDDDQDLVRLLCRALSRLAIAAQGIDRRLDEKLFELRQLLRREIDDPAELSALVDSIDARIKVVDDVRDQRGDLLQSTMQNLIAQLLAVKPGAEVVRGLKALQKEIKHKIADGEELKLLARLPPLQAQVLAVGADAASRGGLLARLFGQGAAQSDLAVRAEAIPAAAATEAVADRAEDAGAEDIAAGEVSAEDVLAEESPLAERSVADMPDPVISPSVPAMVAELRALGKPPSPETESAAADLVEGDPPFTRIATAVCQVLGHLLQQIDPPPSASENYQHACEQIAKGLNWYELVSTLEEIGVIVLAALERGQGEFQEFLLGVNQRLEEAHQVLGASRHNQVQRQRDDEVLNETVRGEVQQMQEQVAVATQLDLLKAAIGTRLDTVIGALDQHRFFSTQRQQELEGQLDTLTERLREMEVQSAAIEARMVEQQRLALLDSLTQLPNRKAYEQRVAEESERWRRYGRPLTLAVCDLDRFKSINDQFGHLAGDKVLRIIAKTLRARLRKSDFIARFGGEEFVILLPETECGEAQHALETLRDAVAQCPFHFREQRVAVTVSIGIAAFVAGSTPDTVFERADTALYRAKEEGRNRCIVVTD